MHSDKFPASCSAVTRERIPRAQLAPAARSALDQRSRALGFRAVSGRAQSHLTCSGAHDLRINAFGSLFRTAADGRLVLDWSQEQLQAPWGEGERDGKTTDQSRFFGRADRI